jgi:hypothetical protein
MVAPTRLASSAVRTVGSNPRWSGFSTSGEVSSGVDVTLIDHPRVADRRTGLDAP